MKETGKESLKCMERNSVERTKTMQGSVKEPWTEV
jgi:hypothetical protein